MNISALCACFFLITDFVRSYRVLTVHGDADEVIPVEDAMKFHKIIPNRRLQIVGGANHGYTSHQAGLTTIVLNFIKAAVWQWYFESSQRGNQYGIS